MLESCTCLPLTNPHVLYTYACCTQLISVSCRTLLLLWSSQKLICDQKLQNKNSKLKSWYISIRILWKPFQFARILLYFCKWFLWRKVCLFCFSVCFSTHSSRNFQWEASNCFYWWVWVECWSWGVALFRQVVTERVGGNRWLFAQSLEALRLDFLCTL